MFKRFLTKKDSYRRLNFYTPLAFALSSFLFSKCGRSGHFMKDCYATTDVSGNKIEYEEGADEWGCEYCDRTFTTAFGCAIHEKSCKEKNTSSRRMKQSSNACYRCGRPGHYSPDCYASRHVKGYELD